MAFSQAISGLNVASSHLDVIGNNIANSATFGFKSAIASFADVYAGSGVGLGVKLTAIQQNFSNGSITKTNRVTDLAISGGGFFRVQDTNGDIFYTRNGQFDKNAKGQLVNPQGMVVTGYPVATINGIPTIQPGASPAPIIIPTDMMNAKATDNISMTANLDSGKAVIPATTTFSPTDNKTYSYSSSVTAFDSLGNERALNVYFVKRGPNAAPSTDVKWDIYIVDPSQTVPTTASLSLNFNQHGQLNPETAASPLAANFDYNLAAHNGSAASVINFNFAGSRQQRLAESNISHIEKNGYQAGEFTSFNFEEDGSISASYSNSQQQLVGQVVLANFVNPTGLIAKGNNVWAETSSSGTALIGTAGTGILGKLTSHALEASNVDMGQELVTMILAQRNYQSNAQTIKTQDQMLQTLVNLR
ncbi:MULTISPECIES: flagellar hook protein FlgE [unclassified Arsenophonus]|uniref:flagellar hook protein FlgE n=1 Tax=unclassified Arsenophonus TaxID=2627083 RepID=UPI00285A6992|nr:flagellar hook protein FlgE [Arsenophonus sp.]MDR5610746.1 flagellar hook protein FlgE [Arsenophonus sp.]MDR5614505.1 flagellar hook protein FlgE [Arsenophonus sp.]